jgi:hypothetical protein
VVFIPQHAFVVAELAARACNEVVVYLGRKDRKNMYQSHAVFGHKFRGQ